MMDELWGKDKTLVSRSQRESFYYVVFAQVVVVSSKIIYMVWVVRGEVFRNKRSVFAAVVFLSPCLHSCCLEGFGVEKRS